MEGMTKPVNRRGGDENPSAYLYRAVLGAVLDDKVVDVIKVT